ncbi:Os07g0191301, partial [Oryza sativa Japonica Group]
ALLLAASAPPSSLAACLRVLATGALHHGLPPPVFEPSSTPASHRTVRRSPVILSRTIDTRRRGQSPCCRRKREAICRCGRARRANTGTQVISFLPPRSSGCIATCTPKVFLHRSVLNMQMLM